MLTWPDHLNIKEAAGTLWRPVVQLHALGFANGIESLWCQASLHAGQVE